MKNIFPSKSSFKIDSNTSLNLKDSKIMDNSKYLVSLSNLEVNNEEAKIKKNFNTQIDLGESEFDVVDKKNFILADKKFLGKNEFLFSEFYLFGLSKKQNHKKIDLLYHFLNKNGPTLSKNLIKKTNEDLKNLIFKDDIGWEHIPLSNIPSAISE